MAMVDLELFKFMATKRAENRVGYLQRVAGRHFWLWTCTFAYSCAQVCPNMPRTGKSILAEGTLIRKDSLVGQM
eukprot:2496473-Heterocapsa_arctica.AAC.1